MQKLIKNTVGRHPFKTNPEIKDTLESLRLFISDNKTELNSNDLTTSKIDNFLNLSCFNFSFDYDHDLYRSTDSSAVLDFWFNYPDQTLFDSIVGYVNIYDFEDLKLLLNDFKSEDFQQMKIKNHNSFKRILLTQYSELVGVEEEIKEYNNTIEHSEGLFFDDYEEFVKNPLNKYSRQLTNFTAKFSKIVQYREDKILNTLDEYNNMLLEEILTKVDRSNSIFVDQKKNKETTLNLYNSIVYFFHDVNVSGFA